MLLKHICNLSHLVQTGIIVGLTHINVTHTITHSAGKLYKPPQCNARCTFIFFLASELCLNAQILTFIYFLFYLCAYILFVLFPLQNPITIAAAAI